jgi:hypothetical protein
VQPRRAAIGLVIAVVAGLGTIGLSFVPAWLAHDRTLLGEGPRHINVELSAWTLQSVPILAAGVVLLAVAAAMAAGRLAGWHRLRAAWGFLVACAGLGLLLAGLGPVSQQGHATGVQLWPQWALGAAIGLAAIAVAGLGMAAGAARRVLVAGVALVIVLGAAGWGGRQVELNLAEGTGRNYSNGSYTRTAADGQPTETLTFTDTTITVGDRWSGAYEGSGRVVSITADPACPDVRGSYHVDAAPNGGITWEKIVDTCAAGARAKDLTTGTWARDH